MPLNDNDEIATLDRFLSRAVALIAIIAIPAGLYGYFASQHNKRVEATFELYKSFRDGKIQEQWSFLLNRWNAKVDDVDRLLAQNDQEGLQRLTRSLVSDEQGVIAFERVAAFFDGVSACVDSGLCDNNTACAMLKDPAHQIAGAYGSYIVYIRQHYKNPKYGTGLFKVRSMEKKFSVFDWL